MKKRCNACGELNAAEAMLCVCGQSLFGAEEVYEDNVSVSEDTAKSSERNHSPATEAINLVSGSECICKFPAPNNDGVCNACDGVVVLHDEQAETSYTVKEVSESIVSPPSTTQPSIFIIRIPNQNICYPLNDKAVVLGRGRNVPGELRHYFNAYTGVSRQHLLLTTHASELLLIDLKSCNGSRAGHYDLEPLQCFTLTASDMPISIQLGRHCCLQIEIEQE